MRHQQYRLGQDLILATSELGNPKTAAKTVVFIHGWLDNGASFYRNMYQLHQRHPDWHLVALDLPGHGASSHKSADNYYPFHDYLSDLYWFLTVLSPNKLCLVGHSLGALIASCYSAAFPEQVSALIQIEGAGPLAETASNATGRLRQGILSRARIAKKPPRSLTTFDKALALRSASCGVDSSLIAPIVGRDCYFDSKLQAWRWRHDSKLKCDSLYRMTLEQANQLVSDIQCPNWVVLGSDGYAQLAQRSQVFSERKVVAGGHHCHLESSSEIVSLIGDVVNKI
ncbi:alpha/beta hydrolase [Vibrio sp. SCSIO 43136]|uniref:alpha/beta fold hydrolase n=1 Tax=Vibrio sp. SCSIO 43136 TaxID=2819101 RepID=UPI002075527B|nr:alpha/beta hydrolase [Vibrio sp. SCSIO 43136]USD64522.1 alpha/beta hydrolase [Vibrio sp. SCSIO 43136]